jgi:hypothetical protein
MRMTVSIGGKSTIALFNPGSQENLMGKESARRLGVVLRKQKQPIQPYRVRGQIITNGLITEDTELVKLQIRDHEEWICFKVTPTEKEDIVLSLF